MTPPDSGVADRHECRCGYHIVGRDAEGSHTWSNCKPDSDAHEVCKVCGRLSVTSLGSCVPGTSIDTVCFRVKCGADTTCYPLGYERLAALVSLEPSLAQRILAALEEAANRARYDHEAVLRALAAELRERLPK